MKLPSSFITFSLFLFLVMPFMISCRTGPDLSDLREAKKTTEKSPIPEQQLSGVYTISGRNENSAKPYDGSLTVDNNEDGYRFNWQTSRNKYSGTGVQMADSVAVSFANGVGVRDCGVVLYKIAEDGTLDGRVVTSGEFTFGTEKAVRIDGTGFEGKYGVTGQTNYGKEYKGTIEIKRDGSGYRTKWSGGLVRNGFGMWRNDRAAIGFGGPQCTFVLYKVQLGGNLEGRWGSERTVAFGSEDAKKQ